MPALCRDCCAAVPEEAPACPACHGRRLVRPPDLFALTVAHVDCDAGHASVEKRDRPELAAKPVIIGGGRRGVVSAACYIARTSDVRSAMPMFKTLRLCPDAVVIEPDMATYVAAARRIRALMEAVGIKRPGQLAALQPRDAARHRRAGKTAAPSRRSARRRASARRRPPISTLPSRRIWNARCGAYAKRTSPPRGLRSPR